jgi:oligopeptide transport system substrate-binding protein
MTSRPARYLTALSVCSLLLHLAACGNADDPAGAPVSRWSVVEPTYIDGRPDRSTLAERQVIHRGNGAQPQGLDPHLTEGVPDSHVQRDLFEGLVVEAADGSLIPGVAERWQISDDGMVYTFHLRPVARWSNGDALTAADFEFSMRRVVTPATGSKYALMLAPILNAEQIIAGELEPQALGVRALDAHTFQITLKAPTPYFLGLLAHGTAFPVHPPSARAHGDQYGRVENLVSNGPFRINEMVVGSHIHVVRNEHFWDTGNVIIDEVFFYPIEDQSAELARYRADELDWTYEVPNARFAWIEANLPDELHIAPYFGTYYFGFNTTRPPFDDVRVRQALAMTIERDIITGRLTRFGEIPSYGFVPPGIPGYTNAEPHWAAWTQAERDAEARRLMTAAGYGPDNPLHLEIRYNTHQNHKKISLGIAHMWRTKLGVRSSLLNEEFRVFLANRKQRMVTQVFRAGWIGDYLDPFTFLEINLSTSGLNDAGWNSPRFDALMNEAAATADPQARMELLHQAESLLLEEVPNAPVYTYVTKRVVKPWVRGWQSNLLDHHASRWMYVLKRERR